MPDITTWPFKVDDQYQGKGIAFENVTATIKLAVKKRDTGDVIGYKFEEDPEMEGDYERTWWGPSGPWDDEANRFLPYTGPIFQQGDLVDLKLRMTVDKNGVERHNISRIRNSTRKSPTETHAAASGGDYANKELATASPQGSQPQTSIDQRINLGMAFNNATAILAAAIQAGTEPQERITKMKPSGLAMFGVTLGEIADQWHKWFNEASRGLPLTPVSDEPAVETQPEDKFEAVLTSENEDYENLPW